MMNLALLNFSNVIIAILCVSLAVLVLIIAYRKLLQYMGKGTPPKEDYCVLYSLEENPSKAEMEFYFTAEKQKEVAIQILDENYNLTKEIYRQECQIGGNIIRFDSTTLPNGNYFFSLVTENQKTMKKMAIAN